MKPFFSALIALALFAACNPDDIDLSGASTGLNIATPETRILKTSVADTTANADGSISVVSLYYADLGADTTTGVQISVPFAEMTMEQYEDQMKDLARLTNGALSAVQKASEVCKAFVDIIDSNLVSNSDVVFMIDATASMYDDIDALKKGIGNILGHLSTKPNVRVGVVVYRDVRDGNVWFSHLPLTKNFEMVRGYINMITPYGGGPDWAESMYDAAALGMDTMEWRPNSNKMILVLGDAPSLTPPVSKNSLDDVVNKSKDHGVSMNYYPIIISPLAIETASEPLVIVPVVANMYPNPTAGPCTLELAQASSYDWHVIDFGGNELNSGQFYGDKFSVDLSDLPNGIYVVRVHDQEKDISEDKRIVVTH